MQVLILHAHPDDELIFAGALRLAHPGWEWQTVSLTGGARAADYPGISLGFADEWRILHRSEFQAWHDAVATLGVPDLVITHNRMGEYGHPHHMAVHAIAHDLFPRVWDFYTEAASTVGPQVRRDELRMVPATPAKRDLFIATYGRSVLDELIADKPDLMARAFRAEWFTYDRSAHL